MSKPTCKDCKFFRIPEGYVKTGHCFALPPIMFKDGSQNSTQTPPPQTNATRPACTYYQPLANGASNVQVKIDPQTVGDAVKQAQADHPLHPIAPAVLPAPKPTRRQRQPEAF